MRQKVSMQQIADYVGVSKFAVSKALAGQPGVSDETRRKIVEAASQLGYFARRHGHAAAGTAPAAAGAAEGDTVMVLLPNVRYQDRQSLYWGPIVDGIVSGLEAHGLGMIIAAEPRADSLARRIRPSAVRGLIGVGFVSNRMLLEIRHLELPFVLVDHEDPLIPCDVLFVNNAECVRRATRFLLDNGHRRLQFVGNVRYARSFYDRWIGFRLMLEEREAKPEQEPDLLSLEGENRSEMTESLGIILGRMKAQDRLPTAFVCANDSIALCVMTALMKLGVDIPGRCSVVGFDDIEDAARAQPPLATVRVDKEALGRRAVETLLWRIARPDAPMEKILQSGEFILRPSASVHR
jgi:LacI family transcriptional regulator